MERAASLRVMAAASSNFFGCNVPGDIQALLRSDPRGGVGDYLSEAKFWLQSAAPGEVHLWHPAHVAEHTRADSVELLFRVCESYKVSSETVCAAVVLQDRFLRAACRIQVDSPSFKDMASLSRDPSMIAITCFLVACKFREMLCPLLKDLEILTGHRCTAEAIRAAEVLILEATDWELHDVTAIDVCNLILSFAPEGQRIHMAQHVEFLCEISYYCAELLPYSTSSVAAAAFMYAAERLNIWAACSNVLPAWMMTTEAEKAKDVLAHCFCILRPDEAPTPAKNEALHIEIPQCAMDMEDMDCVDSHIDVSPTNVDESLYFSVVNL